MMTPSPTPRQQQALESLRGQSDVVDYLTACLEERQAKLVYMQDANDIAVCQGQAQFCKHLLETILGKTQQKSGRRL